MTDRKKMTEKVSRCQNRVKCLISHDCFLTVGVSMRCQSVNDFDSCDTLLTPDNIVSVNIYI